MNAARQDRAPAAFGASLLLHGAVVALLALAAMVLRQPPAPTPKIFELVAGAGDNYMATQAPALGSPHAPALTLNLPQIPSIPAAPAEVQPVPPPAALTPVAPVPVRPVPVRTLPTRTATNRSAPSEQAVPNFAQKLLSRERQRIIHDRWVERQKEIREARAEKAAERRAAAQQHLSYAEYQKRYGVHAVSPVGPGIATGVQGGKGAEAGAHGRALTAEEGDELDRYFSYLKQQLHDEFVQPPDATQDMVAHVVFYLAADGSISHVRITHSTGDAAFNDAVLEAFRRIRMPERPDHQGEEDELDFTLKDQLTE